MKKSSNGKNYPLYSSETVNLALPLACLLYTSDAADE